MSTPIEITPIALDDPEVLPLVERQVHDLAQRHGVEPWPLGDPAQYLRPDGVFLIARVDGVAAGCGGLRRTVHDPAVGEVKRMWTEPTFRRQGIAHALLDAIEGQWARTLGFQELILSSAAELHEAIALYEARGWQQIPNDERFGFWDRAAVYQRSVDA